MADLKLILAIFVVILPCIVALTLIVALVVIAKTALAETKPQQRPDILRALAEVFAAISPRGWLALLRRDSKERPPPEPMARAPAAPKKPRAVG